MILPENAESYALVGECLTQPIRRAGVYKEDIMINQESVKNEIIRKLDRMNLVNIDISSGMHVSTHHVGLSDEELLRRQKQDRQGFVSSFVDENTVNVCLYEMFSDEYFLEKELIPFLSAAAEKMEFEYDSFDCDTVGRVVLPNGGILEVNSFRIVLSKSLAGGGERDINTGMPFSVITMFPVKN